MQFNLGPQSQLREHDYRQMMEDERRRPGEMRRRGCFVFFTLMAVVLILVLIELFAALS
jgi:hypothetical protein